MLGCAYDMHEVECSLRKFQVSHRSRASLSEWGKSVSLSELFLSNSEWVLERVINTNVCLWTDN